MYSLSRSVAQIRNLVAMRDLIRLKEYIIKGFAMDDERLKQMGGGTYWYELLNRIRDIRSSEKVMYRRVLDTIPLVCNEGLMVLSL